MAPGAFFRISPVIFLKLVTKEERGLMADNYFHYFHHRCFTVNDGVESVPLDKWFGSFHDGSPEAHAPILARRSKARKSDPSPQPQETGGVRRNETAGSP